MEKEVLKTILGLIVMLMIIGWVGNYDYEEQVEANKRNESVSDIDEAENSYDLQAETDSEYTCTTWQ